MIQGKSIDDAQQPAPENIDLAALLRLLSGKLRTNERAVENLDTLAQIVSQTVRWR